MTYFTSEQLAEIRIKNDEKAEKHLSAIYGAAFGPALYRACVKTWGCGPAVATARLSDAADEITAAWALKDDLAGLLLRKDGLSYVPLYLSSEALAYKLCGKSDLWISFSAINKELKP